LTKILGTTYPKKYDLEDIFVGVDQNGDSTITKEEYGLLTNNLKSVA
jgi:hypothetical protein